MAHSMQHPMQRLFQYLAPFKWRLRRNILASALNKVLDLMPPLLVAWVIDSVRGEAPDWIRWVLGTEDPFHLAMLLAVLGFLIFGLESLFQWVYTLGFMRLSQDVQHQLRLDTFKRMQSREIAYFETQRLGNSLAILNDDVNQLEQFLNSAFSEFCQLVVLVIFAGTVMVSTSWQLALFALVPVPFIVMGSLLYQSKISPKYQKVREAVGHLNSRLENSISGIVVVKSFAAETIEFLKVSEESDRYRRLNYEAIRLNALYVPLIRMGIAFGFAGVLLIGSYWILDGQDFLTVGELVLFSMMIQRLLWPLTRMGALLDEYERAGASARRVFEVMDTESKIVNAPRFRLESPVKGELAFEAVHFSYGPQLPVLRGIDFNLSPGETVGIAGTTGSGKSTLIKCLLRLYDVDSGVVKLDGRDVRDYGIRELRRQIALVSQDVYLFHGSIRENIAYGANTAADSEIIRAAEMAELHDFVQSLPDGYESIVGERGIKLSGGQRQRLSIARALLKDAPIMVFDEATSSVDTETERAIQSNIYRLTEGKTALIIAHRLSTIRHADRIMVLDEGKVLESGTHEALIKSGGMYADLWSVQIGDSRV